MANYSVKKETQVETDGAGVKSVTPLESEDAYKDYVDFMPDELLQDNIDALIICSSKDGESVKTFEKYLRKDVCYKYEHDMIRPKVKLFGEICEADGELLEKLLDLTTYTFLFLTKSFCEEQWPSLVLQACLRKMMSDPNKKRTIIPVHSMFVCNRNYKLPLYLEPLKSIEYLRNDQFYKELINGMFSRKASERFGRDADLNARRRNYFLNNKERLIRMKNPGMPAHYSFRMAPGSVEENVQTDGVDHVNKLIFQHSCQIETDSPVACSKPSRSSFYPNSNRKGDESNISYQSNTANTYSSGSSFELPPEVVSSQPPLSLNLDHDVSSSSSARSTTVFPSDATAQFEGSKSAGSVSNNYMNTRADTSDKPIEIHHHYHHIHIQSVQNAIFGRNGQICTSASDQQNDHCDSSSLSQESREVNRDNFSATDESCSTIQSANEEALPDLMNPISIG